MLDGSRQGPCGFRVSGLQRRCAAFIESGLELRQRPAWGGQPFRHVPFADTIFRPQHRMKATDMALKATIFKAELQIADMDRHYYQDHALTIARHPSETDERMMVRLLAFALHADESLVFGKGLSTDEEPDLWQKDLTGAIDLWLDVGLPDEKRLRKAAGRARQVVVYSYGGSGADRWWSQAGTALERVRNLTVMNLPKASSQALAKLAQLSMRLQFTIQEGQIWIRDEKDSVQVDLIPLKTQ